MLAVMARLQIARHHGEVMADENPGRAIVKRIGRESTRWMDNRWARP